MTPSSSGSSGLHGFGPRGASLLQVGARFLRDREGFVAAVQSPVVVWEGAAREDASVDAPSSDPTATLGSAVPTHPGQALIFPVQKHAGHANAFPMGVTLGRLSSNDVVLPLPTVSRFHAWLQRDDRSGVWSVSDAESDHGTYLEGRRLGTGQPQPVGEDARLLLGSVELRFLSPARFLAWLEGHLQA